MPHLKLHHCRVCGLYHAEPPWGKAGNSPTFVICDCCGVEFGYEDCTPQATINYRNAWLASGAKWQLGPRPVDWNLEDQLKDAWR